MASYSAILRLSDFATGESAEHGFSNWGEMADSNFAFLEDAVGEVTSKVLSSSNVTLTDDEERSLLIDLSGTLSANVEVRTNDRKGFWIVRNATSGAFTVTFQTVSGTGATVDQGKMALFVSDGTNLIKVLSDETTTVASGGTGATTEQAALTALFNAARLIVDEYLLLVDPADNTKRGRFDGGSISAGQTRIQTIPDADGVLAHAGYAAKDAGYTLVLADRGQTIRFSGAYTASLTAAATLGTHWHAWVVADGGDVTIDPDGSETINGAATLTVPDGSWCRVVCDGAGFEAGLFQPYDADTLKADAGDVLSAAFEEVLVDDGTKSSGTYTPDPTDTTESLSRGIVNGGAFTLGEPAPSANDTVLRMEILITNNASAGAITTTAFSVVTGDDFTTTDGDDFLCRITVFDDGGTHFSHLDVVALQ